LLTRKWRSAMDAKYFLEKAELCLRLADGLSLNNPGRFQLMDLAEDFQKRAKELETQEAEQQQSKPYKGAICFYLLCYRSHCRFHAHSDRLTQVVATSWIGRMSTRLTFVCILCSF